MNYSLALLPTFWLMDRGAALVARSVFPTNMEVANSGAGPPESAGRDLKSWSKARQVVCKSRIHREVTIWEMGSGNITLLTRPALHTFL